jgi:hypothetical protein
MVTRLQRHPGRRDGAGQDGAVRLHDRWAAGGCRGGSAVWQQGGRQGEQQLAGGLLAYATLWWLAAWAANRHILCGRPPPRPVPPLTPHTTNKQQQTII